VSDAFALTLAVASPELDLVGVTTVGRGPTRDPFVPGERIQEDDCPEKFVAPLLPEE
jgi:GH24 family phage-related lysozyme (muramidase)